MCHAFASEGHKVSLYVPAWEGGSHPLCDVFKFYGVSQNFDIQWLRVPGLGARLSPLRRLAQVVYSLYASWKARRQAPDLVYGRSFLACCTAALLGCTVFFESHVSIAANSWRGKLLSHLVKRGNIRKVVVISNALKEYYATKMGLPAANLIVAHDAADIPEFQENVANEPSDGRLQVGYVGHLYPGKGMEIISRLIPKCPWADFHIVGGKDHDIEKWRLRLNSYKNIYFHGFVMPGETERYRQRCDVLLAPYQQKVLPYGKKGTDLAPWMSPLKLFEYMASGKAILCSNLNVLQEVLDNQKTGIFCDSENIDEWADMLKKLRDDENFRIQLGENARSEFLSKYTWQARASSIVKAL